MEKEKQYVDTRFSAETLKDAVAATRDVAARTKADVSNLHLTVEHDDSTWNYDTIEEFLADFRKYKGYAYFSVYGLEIGLNVSF